MDFSEYVVARRASLVRAVVLLGCPIADAEDIVQTALMKCHRSWRRVQHADHPEAYVYRVLVNTFRDAGARRWTGEVPTDQLADRADGAEPGQACPAWAAEPGGRVEADHLLGIEVRRALASMSREHCEVLVLRYLADFSEAQTAHVLGIPLGTAKSRTARALAALAAHPSLRSTDAH